MGLLINDGYTLSGKVKAQGPWPEVNYRYRPALFDAIEDYLQAKRDSGKQAAKAVADFLAKHLVSWDVVDDKGESVAITPEVLRRVPHPVLREMLNAVQGYGADEQVEDVKNSATG